MQPSVILEHALTPAEHVNERERTQRSGVGRTWDARTYVNDLCVNGTPKIRKW